MDLQNNSDKQLEKLHDYEDIFDYTKKVMDEYEKSEFAVDYTQSELASIKELLRIQKMYHQLAFQIARFLRKSL